MATLIFDIETVGEDFGSLDETTQEVLTRWIKKEADDEEEYREELAELKDGLGFSPLTGSIVALGLFDDEKEKGVVYFQSPEAEAREFSEDMITFKPMSEKDMLEAFWAGARAYDTFVSFNGRGFDAPFLAIRSAVHGVRPTKDLMSNRYLGSQPYDAKHVDLLDQLTYYGAVRKRGNLHLWCRAFGIKSPKADGITGDDVGRLFREKKYAEIARYNVGDLDATRALYHKWHDYLKFTR